MAALKGAVILVLVTSLCHQASLAQVDSWERIKLIEPGKNVSVKLHSGKTMNGKMESWKADGLGIRQGKDKIVPVAKSDVAQVAMVTGMSRGRRAAYAGLIAGGAMGGLGAAAAASDSQFLPIGWVVLVVVISSAFIGGVAAGIAALFPQHKEVIYTFESAGGRK